VTATPSAYCTRADIEAVFGPLNVSRWADLDNDNSVDVTDPDTHAVTLGKISLRIANAIAVVSAELETKFRRSRYTVPFTADGDAGMPADFVNLVATLAGVWLYEKRGVEDYDEDTGMPRHKLAWAKKDANKTIAAVQAGKQEWALATSGEDTPAAVSGDDVLAHRDISYASEGFSVDGIPSP
jgi:hypothetical protein